MSLQSGTTLGPYEIGSSLGAGGMGEVYRARDTRLAREVALKTLPESVAADPERLARFRREAETLAALNHPNIATIFGFEQFEAVSVLAMELVEGPSLVDRIARAPMPLDEMLPIAKQLTLALEAAHERGIIHRDLKPANIKITADGVVKLLDFGLAKALDTTAAGGASHAAGITASPTMSVMATQAGVLLGTAAYMSPEQVRGGAVDKRADIWAFGVVLYEMLTGRGLFAGDTISDTLAGVLREPIDLAALPPSTPDSVRQLLARCLERDPKRRLRDVGEARIAIDDYLANPAAVALPAAKTRSSPLTVAVPWTLAAVLAVALVFALIDRTRQASPNIAEPASFDIDLGGITMRSGAPIGGYVAISPDGRRIVVAAMPETASVLASQLGPQRLYQRTLDRPEFSPIPGTEESSIPFISPDSQWVGFISHGQLKKVAFAGGVGIRICDVNGAVPGATWLDNDTIVFASAGRLFQVPAAGGSPQPVTPESPDGVGFAWPAAIRGRNAVLYALRSTIAPRRSRQVGILDLDTHKDVVIADAGTYPRFVDGFVVYAQQASDPRTNNGFSGGILAVPFDLSKLSVTGPPVAVLENVRVHSGGAGNYDLATNGTAVLVHGAVEGTRNIGWFTRSGGDGTADVRFEPISALRGWQPRLSRDGRVLLVATGTPGPGLPTSIFTYSLDRGGLARLPVDGNVLWPIFGPDEGTVTFWSQSQSGLWTTQIDGSKPPERLTQRRTVAGSAQPGQLPGSWTRDGRNLVFLDFTDATSRIMLLRRGDHSATPMVQSSADNRDPTLSPDDRWLAYASNESGRFEVYVRPFPGPAGRYTVSTEGGVMPAWSKDGRSLYYVSEAGLMITEVTSTDPFRASTPRKIRGTERTAQLEMIRVTNLLGRPFDVAADGRIVYAQSEDSEMASLKSIRLVLHFDQDVRRRLTSAKP